jgi:hypothetical protein
MATPTELLTRLLTLAELAVDEALEFEYDDPEDRHIWRELQELKPLVAEALAQPEPQGATDEELAAAYWEAFKNAAPCGADQSWLAGLRAVALWGRSALEPVPASEQDA